MKCFRSPVFRAGAIAVAVAALSAVPAPVFAYSGTTGLQPDLERAYTAASQEARAEGVSMYINSGRRSWATQESMWEQGIAEYGSPAAARRWVLPPDESTHVTGNAIDVGPRAGAAWLAANGNRWGLCRSYANEWWHFEVATAPGGQCPAPLPDAGDR